MRYVHTGKLTDTIPAGLVAEAAEYLAEDDMTPYFTMWEKDLEDVVLYVRWNLSANGRDYTIEAITTRELTDKELHALNEWAHGQNSDGLGENFEQQPFAWIGEEDGPYFSEDEEEDGGRMVSFDWETNEVSFRPLEPKA